MRPINYTGTHHPFNAKLNLLFIMSCNLRIVILIFYFFSEALLIDPCNRSTNAKLYFNRATVAAKQKKTNECISDCDKALELDASYVKPLLRRAKCYMESEQYEEAVRDYEKVLKSDKGNMEYR